MEENNRKGQNVARGETWRLVLNNTVMEKEMAGAVPWRGENMPLALNFVHKTLGESETLET
jgi:hypothetical protein